MNILVIGGGIHGCCVTDELLNHGHKVTLIDKNCDILQETSKSTHNRIHLGYHYPRSLETAQECKDSYSVFIEKFGDCLIFPEFYYFIAKENSYLNAKQYDEFLHEMGLENNNLWPDESLIYKDKLEQSYLTKEGCFSYDKIYHKLKSAICENSMCKFYNFFELTKFEVCDEFVNIFSKGAKIHQKFDCVINCTYSYTNNLQKILGIPELPIYKFEQTEIVVVECGIDIPPLTIMDGPFITILPYVGHMNQYLIYDVVNSRIKSWNDISFEKKEIESNHELILDNCKTYFKFIDSVKYVKSLYANRPIHQGTFNDSRVTRISKYQGKIPIYSILEGKFATAPLISKQMVKQIEEEMLITANENE